MKRPARPGRDRRAVHHPGPSGAERLTGEAKVVVVGGGIAGLSAATILAERGVRVTLVEASPRLGGRVAAWPLEDGRTMSRGFHAFFRQYYNLRAVLRRPDPDLARLIPIRDYPLQRPDGMRDSFNNIPRTPPFSVMGFVARSPSFTLASLAKVDVPAALELLRVRFPDTYSHYDGESAAAFLDRLRFPADARDLALEVFARSFFADPNDFAAGELVAMFHTYFMGSAEGLLFDVPDDDYDTALWQPLGHYLARLGVEVRTGVRVSTIGPTGARTNHGELIEADAVVLATDPRTARSLVAGIGPEGSPRRSTHPRSPWCGCGSMRWSPPSAPPSWAPAATARSTTFRCWNASRQEPPPGAGHTEDPSWNCTPTRATRTFSGTRARPTASSST